jgi:hypothetical protein
MTPAQNPFEEDQSIIEEAKANLKTWDRSKLSELLVSPQSEKRMIQGKF